jgi:DNA invertase Pin-like site-specific DNA recombinase
METVIGYLRVSTREQADSRLGLEAQRRAITEEGQRRGWDVRFIEDAGHTGRNDRRPGLQEALRALRRKEARALVVAKLDRLSRSVQHFARFLDLAQKQRWALVALDPSVDMTQPSGRMVANILVAVAQWESEMIGVRTADAMAQGKANGARYGRTRMTPPAVVRRIVRLRNTGQSYTAIAATLDASHTPTPNGGKRWHHATVARLHHAATKEA